MNSKRWWLLGLALSTLAVLLWLLFARGSRSQRSSAAPASGPPLLTRAAREELEKFQGAWDFVSLVVEGESKPEADFKKYTVTFKADQWIVTEGTNVAAQITVALDPTTNPKSVDAFPRPGKGQPIHGIYALEGDKLTICDRGEDQGDRPTEFSSEPNSGLVLIEYKRAHR